MDVPPRCISELVSLQAGLNRAKKLLKQQNAKKIYLALDADASVEWEVCELCKRAGLEPDRGHTKAELGTLCGLEVDCAVCAVPID